MVGEMSGWWYGWYCIREWDAGYEADVRDMEELCQGVME